MDSAHHAAASITQEDRHSEVAVGSAQEDRQAQAGEEEIPTGDHHHQECWVLVPAARCRRGAWDRPVLITRVAEVRPLMVPMEGDHILAGHLLVTVAMRVAMDSAVRLVITITTVLTAAVLAMSWAST